MKKKQADQEGYLEGLHTGMRKGYQRGIKDALLVAQTMLDENGVHMSDTEFYTQMQIMTDEGEITPYDFKYSN